MFDVRCPMSDVRCPMSDVLRCPMFDVRCSSNGQRATGNGSRVTGHGHRAIRITGRAEREKAIAAVRAAAPAGPRRVFVGKNSERAATVSLADANGKPRLTLTVDAAGNPR